MDGLALSLQAACWKHSSYCARSEAVISDQCAAKWPLPATTPSPGAITSASVADAVLRREAEFGINIAGARRAELKAEPLLKDRFVLICRDDHPFARHRRRTWKQVEAYPLISARQVSGNRTVLDLALAESAPGLEARYEMQRSCTAALSRAAQALRAMIRRRWPPARRRSTLRRIEPRSRL